MEREDYIDDLGLQAAQAFWGLLHTKTDPDKKFDQWLGELYVFANKESEKPEVKAEIDVILRKTDGSADRSRPGREGRCPRSAFWPSSKPPSPLRDIP